jgi:hypothetical protein
MIMKISPARGYKSCVYTEMQILIFNQGKRCEYDIQWICFRRPTNCVKIIKNAIYVINFFPFFCLIINLYIYFIIYE